MIIDTYNINSVTTTFDLHCHDAIVATLRIFFLKVLIQSVLAGIAHNYFLILKRWMTVVWFKVQSLTYGAYFYDSCGWAEFKTFDKTGVSVVVYLWCFVGLLPCVSKRSWAFCSASMFWYSILFLGLCLCRPPVALEGGSWQNAAAIGRLAEDLRC